MAEKIGLSKWLIESAGKKLESVLVKLHPFLENKCVDQKCLPNKNEKKNKISCRRNIVG